MARYAAFNFSAFAIAFVRAGIAFAEMAARAYVAGNAGLMALTRTTLAAITSVGPLGLLRMVWTMLAITTVSMDGLMTTAMTWVCGSIRAMGAALMANPLGIILGIASAALQIYENWDTVKRWFADLVHWLAGKLHGVMNAARSVGHMLGLGSYTPKTQPMPPQQFDFHIHL